MNNIYQIVIRVIEVFFLNFTFISIFQKILHIFNFLTITKYSNVDEEDKENVPSTKKINLLKELRQFCKEAKEEGNDVEYTFFNSKVDKLQMELFGSQLYNLQLVFIYF